MKSLKTRLLLWVCGATAGVMIAAAGALYGLARAYLIEQLDLGVTERLDLIVSMIELDGDAIELEFEDVGLQGFDTRDGGWYLNLSLDTHSVYQSQTLDGHAWELPWSVEPSRTVRWFRLPEGSWGRGVFVRLEIAEGPSGAESDLDLALLLARDASEVLNTLRYLVFGLSLVTVMALGLLGLILIWVVGRSMRPVEALARTIGQIDETDLRARLQLEALPKELAPIVEQFNGLMTRLHVAFERERGFCADVAHELRTPLAGLRTTLEVTLGRPRNHAEYGAAIERCRMVVLQTQDLVDGLLQLGRLETGQIVLRTEHVELNHQLEAVWKEVTEETSPSKACEVRWRLAEGLGIWTDPIVLHLVLRNLLANAWEYVNEKGEVEIESDGTSEGVRLMVSNSGCQIEAEEVHRVFDRFWRGSKSRSGTGSHFGLGLSLARRAAELLGGTLAAEAEYNGRFRAIFVLPSRGKLDSAPIVDPSSGSR